MTLTLAYLLIFRGDGQTAQDGEMGYFLLDVGSSFNVEKLSERISEVHHTFEDHKKDSIKEIINHFNW